ncbi:MAG: hypothetical protein MI919_34560 [Holophagales bacterium]|nr:hypothetical protein [Holophagales bacterium]
MRRVLFVALVCLLLSAIGATSVAAQVETVTKEEYAAMSKEERMAAKAEAVRLGQEQPFTGTLRTGIETETPPKRQPETPSAVFGTVIYDTGVFDTIPTQPAGITDILSYGNQFNSHNGNPIPAPSVTVTQIAVWPALVNGSTTASGSAFMTVFGPVNTAGTNASPILSVNHPGIVPQTWNTVAHLGTVSPATGTGTAASFLIGMFGGASGAGTPCNSDCVGLDTGIGSTVNGQGFHGMRVDDFGGGDFGTIASANALLRAIGNVVPVELMSFSIED